MVFVFPVTLTSPFDKTAMFQNIQYVLVIPNNFEVALSWKCSTTVPRREDALQRSL